MRFPRIFVIVSVLVLFLGGGCADSLSRANRGANRSASRAATAAPAAPKQPAAGASARGPQPEPQEDTIDPDDSIPVAINQTLQAMLRSDENPNPTSTPSTEGEKR